MVLTALVCCQPLCQVEQVAMGLAILPETEAKGRASAVSAVPRACRRQAGQAAMRLEMARLMVVKLRVQWLLNLMLRLPLLTLRLVMLLLLPLLVLGYLLRLLRPLITAGASEETGP